jgi:ABC-type branched-subunit amino acid transport system substrate-binding protein
MKYLYIVYLLLCFSSIFGQTSPQDFKNQYMYGKNLLAEKRFELALETFKPLLQRHSNNNFYEYANFYYAYAAFQRKEYSTAITTLKTLSTEIGNLKKNDEIFYLLANAQFLQNEIVEACATLQKINSPTLRKEGNNMQANFIATCNAVKDLKQLHIIYPNDIHISFRLFQVLSAQKDNSTDKMLLAELTKKHTKTTENTSIPTENTQNIPKDSATPPTNSKTSIDIGLLLPMLMKDTEADKPVRKNQFVIDFYYGLLVAQDKLKEEGITTNLYLYDTEKDENKIKSILKTPNLQNVDMLIGPMFPKDTPPVVNFAMANNIILINPLTNNAEAIKKYNNAFLTEPSSEAMGSKAADYTYKNFSDTTIIYFGNQRQDSILATHYMQKFKDLGGKVTIFKNIANIKNAFKLVSTDLASYIGKQTKASVFVAITDQTLAVNLLSGIQSNNLAVPIITTQDWLEFKQVTYEQLEQSKVSFLFNSYLDYYAPAVRAFDTKYIDKSNMIPSRFSYAGYDALYYFAKMINKYGKDIRKGVAENEKIEDLLLQGFDYRNGHDNQRLAIGVFKDGKLEVSFLE